MLSSNINPWEEIKIIGKCKYKEYTKDSKSHFLYSYSAVKKNDYIHQELQGSGRAYNMQRYNFYENNSA